MQDKFIESLSFELFDMAGDMIVFYNLSKGFIYCNSATTKLLGYTQDEFSRFTFVDIVSAEYQHIAKELINNKTSGIFELALYHKNGTTCLVELNTSWADKENESVMIGVFRKISFSRNHEETISLSEERYRLLIENQGEGIGVVDLNENFVFVNPAAEQIFGVNPGELLNRNLAEFVFPSQFNVINNETVKRSKGEKSSYEIDIIDAKNQHISILVTATPQFNSAGEHTGTFGIFRDITKRKEIEIELILAKEKAEELNTLKSSLLLNISHELRTPMNGILGFSTLLKDELSDSELKNMADIILRSGNRLMTTLNSIIELAQVEADKTQLLLENLDIGELTSTVIETNETLFDFSSLVLKVNIETGLFSMIDKKLYTNIVFHLIDNAVKFTKEGSVTVVVTKEIYNNEESVVLKVSDTGIGISDIQLTYIFDAFRQGTEGVGRRHEGTGLGLTLCIKFISMMNGSIDVSSTIGKGTTFTVRFKASAYQPGKIAKSPFENNGNFLIYGNKPRIMIVEDNKFNAELITIYLGNDFISNLVFSGPEAVKLAGMIPFDMILMDINLGQDMDGILAAKEIRSIPRYKEIPIIAITGYSSFEERKYILEQGLTDLLSKPFDKKTLISIINNVFSKYSNK